MVTDETRKKLEDLKHRILTPDKSQGTVSFGGKTAATSEDLAELITLLLEEDGPPEAT